MKLGPEDDEQKSPFQKIANKVIWLVGTARNAILVIVTGAIAYFLHQSGQDDLQLIGAVPAGMPAFQVPPFSVPDVVNETTGEVIQKGETFSEMISDMGSALIVIPLIALLENISVCKAFANGKSVDATQELLAIGASNIVNSFAQGFPGTGSLSRGAVNNASGVRTPLGSLYTGALVILALMFMTPLFYYIPKAALASIIIAAVIFMIEVRVVKPMWRSKSASTAQRNFPKRNLTNPFRRNRPDSRDGRLRFVSGAASGNRHFVWHRNKCDFHFVSRCQA